MGSKTVSERKDSDLDMNKDVSNLKLKGKYSGEINLIGKDVYFTSGGIPFLTFETVIYGFLKDSQGH